MHAYTIVGHYVKKVVYGLVLQSITNGLHLQSSLKRVTQYGNTPPLCLAYNKSFCSAIQQQKTNVEVSRTLRNKSL